MTVKCDSDEMLKICLCVAKCRQRLGRSMIIDVLRASHSVRVFNRRLYLNSAFGLLREHSAEELNGMIDDLVAQGLLEETEDEYPRLLLTDSSKAMLHEHIEDLEEMV